MPRTLTKPETIPRIDTQPLHRLSVSSVRLHYFRNYQLLDIETGSNNVVLVGPNGAGKTNVLEALSMLVPGRGLRKAKLAEMDQAYADQSWVVSAQINGIQGECQLGTAKDESGAMDKRTVRVDGTTLRSQAELGKHLSMLWLTPQMEQLFNQGTSEGRRFLDRLVYSFDMDHASRINKYDYAMRERNRLLNQGNLDPHWLDSLEQTMAEMAAAIAQTRLDTLASLNHAIDLSKRPFPKAQIAVDGTVENLLENGMTALAAETNFREKLVTNRRKDAAADRTLLGPHRSLLKVVHLEKQLPAESCSTGEQKALLLSIILAQARAATLWKQVVPVLLLDDVPSHLDSSRQLELFEEIGQIGAQVWMTGTDLNFFAPISTKTLFFHVDNAKLQSVKAT